jgi:hypothetical protein
MTFADFALIIHAQIQQLRQVRKEIDLTICSLRGLLPDKRADERRKIFLVNPESGKREKMD